MTENSAVSAIEQHYHERPPHPTDTEEKGWIMGQPHAKIALRWIGTDRKVIDLGCHKGDLSAAVRDAGNDVTGVDFGSLTTLAEDKFHLKVVAHDLNQPFPFEDNSADVVMAISILDYIAGDLAFFKECNRILKPDGFLVVAVANAASIYSRVALLLGQTGRNFRDDSGYHTLNYYTLKGLRDILDVAGFKVADVDKCPKVNSRIPLRYWIEKILPATFATDLAVRAVKK